MYAFHGGCSGCDRQHRDGDVGNCVGCQYMEHDWSLPDLNPKHAARRAKDKEMIKRAKNEKETIVKRALVPASRVLDL